MKVFDKLKKYAAGVGMFAAVSGAAADDTKKDVEKALSGPDTHEIQQASATTPQIDPANPVLQAKGDEKKKDINQTFKHFGADECYVAAERVLRNIEVAQASHKHKAAFQALDSFSGDVLTSGDELHKSMKQIGAGLSKSECTALIAEHDGNSSAIKMALSDHVADGKGKKKGLFERTPKEDPSVYTSLEAEGDKAVKIAEEVARDAKQVGDALAADDLDAMYDARNQIRDKVPEPPTEEEIEQQAQAEIQGEIDELTRKMEEEAFAQAPEENELKELDDLPNSVSINSTQDRIAEVAESGIRAEKNITEFDSLMSEAKPAQQVREDFAKSGGSDALKSLDENATAKGGSYDEEAKDQAYRHNYVDSMGNAQGYGDRMINTDGRDVAYAVMDAKTDQDAENILNKDLKEKKAERIELQEQERQSEEQVEQAQQIQEDPSVMSADMVQGMADESYAAMHAALEQRIAEKEAEKMQEHKEMLENPALAKQKAEQLAKTEQLQKAEELQKEAANDEVSIGPERTLHKG